uniref:Uncharacterized protein n=1 Tax=Arundo donax TaxID=35708 RepID=A0A0A9FU49_ARUDO
MDYLGSEGKARKQWSRPFFFPLSSMALWLAWIWRAMQLPKGLLGPLPLLFLVGLVRYSHAYSWLMLHLKVRVRPSS